MRFAVQDFTHFLEGAVGRIGFEQASNPLPGIEMPVWYTKPAKAGSQTPDLMTP
jgi:hypothetical protein